MMEMRQRGGNKYCFPLQKKLRFSLIIDLRTIHSIELSLLVGNNFKTVHINKLDFLFYGDPIGGGTEIKR